MKRKKASIPAYPWGNQEPVKLLLTCDVCKDEVKPDGTGIMTVDTVLCASCADRAVKSLRKKV